MKPIVGVVQLQRAEEQSANAKTRADPYNCPGCGKRTRDRTGRCHACQHGAVGTDLERLTHQQLVMLRQRVADEIERRRKELEP